LPAVCGVGILPRGWDGEPDGFGQPPEHRHEEEATHGQRLHGELSSLGPWWPA